MGRLRRAFVSAAVLGCVLASAAADDPVYTVYYGDYYIIEAVDHGLVGDGSENLRAITLRATAVDVAGLNLGGVPSPGVFTGSVYGNLHQEWLPAPGGRFRATTGEAECSATAAACGSLDSHFLYGDYEVLRIGTPTEDMIPGTSSEATDYAVGFGTAMTATYALAHQQDATMEIAYLVIPDGDRLTLDAEIAGAGVGVEARSDYVQTNFTLAELEPAEVRWAGAAGVVGEFTDSANWEQGVAPGTQSRAVFAAGPDGESFAAIHENTHLGAVAVSGGAAIHLDHILTASHVTVSGSAGRQGVLRFGGGALEASQVLVACEQASVARLELKDTRLAARYINIGVGGELRLDGGGASKTDNMLLAGRLVLANSASLSCAYPVLRPTTELVLLNGGRFSGYYIPDGGKLHMEGANTSLTVVRLPDEANIVGGAKAVEYSGCISGLGLSGILRVKGSGSSLTASNLGMNGTAELSDGGAIRADTVWVQSGALLTVASGARLAGRSAQRVGKVEVLRTGVVRVQAGGTVLCDELVIDYGINSTSAGTVRIGGSAGGQTATVDALSVTISAGTAEVLDGGRLQSATLVVGPEGTLRVDGGEVVLTGGLKLQAGGVMSLCLTSSLADGQDAAMITCMGTAALDGELQVELGDDTAPAVGDVFRLFAFATVTGDFSTVTLPELAEGLTWCTDALRTGQISVVAALADTPVVENPPADPLDPADSPDLTAPTDPPPDGDPADVIDPLPDGDPVVVLDPFLLVGLRDGNVLHSTDPTIIPYDLPLGAIHNGPVYMVTNSSQPTSLTMGPIVPETNTPEPATAILLAAGAAALLRRRRPGK